MAGPANRIEYQAPMIGAGPRPEVVATGLVPGVSGQEADGVVLLLVVVGRLDLLGRERGGAEQEEADEGDGAHEKPIG
jgi:hypothetical protein